MRASSLAFRLTGAALLASFLALVVAGIVISGLLRNFVEESFATTLDATSVALMANTAFDDELGRLSVDTAVADPRFEQPLSGWYWTIADNSGVLLRSGSLWNGQLSTPSETDGAFTLQAPDGAALLGLTRRFTVPGGTDQLTILATAPRAQIDAETGTIVGPLVIALVVLGVSLALALVVQVYFGLRPLRRLGHNLTRIAKGEIERLPGESYRELTPVIEQMNGLIAHSAETLTRTRNHVGNLAHGLKTPLSIIRAELAKPASPQRDAALVEGAATMERQISHHLRRARSAAAGGLINARTELSSVVADLLPVFAGVYADRNLRVRADVAPGLAFAGERQDLEELLGNLIDNACKWAGTTVVISATPRDAHSLLVTVTDDGAGMSVSERAVATERGRRFDETAPGSGLGLSIVTDLANLYGGALTLDAGQPTGLVATLRLPRAL